MNKMDLKRESRSIEHSNSKRNKRKKSKESRCTSKSSHSSNSDISVRRRNACKDKRKRSKHRSSSSNSSSSSSVSSHNSKRIERKKEKMINNARDHFKDQINCQERAGKWRNERKCQSNDKRKEKFSKDHKLFKNQESKLSQSHDRLIESRRSRHESDPYKSRNNDRRYEVGSSKPRKSSLSRSRSRSTRNINMASKSEDKYKRDSFDNDRRSRICSTSEISIQKNSIDNKEGISHFRDKLQDDQPVIKKTRKTRKVRSSSSSSSSSTSTSNSDTSGSSSSSSSSNSKDKLLRKKRKKTMKKLKKTKKKRKKKEKKMKKKLKKKVIKSIAKEKDQRDKKSSPDRLLKDIPQEIVDKAKAMAPMTKEEWEKKQSIIRRVYDEETGRHRLIKGDGEILEEIVSRERHMVINRQATQGDGKYFQSQLGINK